MARPGMAWARQRAGGPAVVALLVAVALLGGACASQEDVADQQADDSGGMPSEQGSEDGDAAAEGPQAPDFTLELADGSEFVLSEEERATFLVFWAEW